MIDLAVVRSEVCFSLKLDKVLSETQVQRWYGLNIASLSERELEEMEAFVFPLEVRSSKDAPSMLMNFISDQPRDLQETSGQIVHYAGTAEIRHLLGRQKAWSSVASALGRSDVPDAVFEGRDGPQAIEFDTGSYPAWLVRDKLDHFKDYAQIHWGCSSAVRAKHLKEKYRELKTLSVWHAAWWV